MNSKCKVCGRDITIQIFKGTDVCSDLCRKVKEKEVKASAAND